MDRRHSSTPATRVFPSRWSGIRALAAAVALLGTACYKPDFSTAIYRCETDGCPSGLSCNKDKFCVVLSSPGCKEGGIAVSATMDLCPGVSNACNASYVACMSGFENLACSGQLPDLKGGADPDMGPPISCLVCCLK